MPMVVDEDEELIQELRYDNDKRLLFDGGVEKYKLINEKYV